MENNSIYVLEERYMNRILEYAEVMKPIMVKGVGYIFVSKNFNVTPDLLLNIAVSMENQGIKSL